MFSAISTSTTITITPVVNVTPAQPVAAPTASGPVSPVAAAGATAAAPAPAAARDAGAAQASSSATQAAASPKAEQKVAVARLPLTLDAQLMRVENKLADCVNCPSAKTLSGQAQIDALSSQVRAIRQQMFNSGSGAAAYTSVPTPIGLNLNACV
ncbi:hypothetical protein [Pelomonas sp. KK5]|uniref:hypothetical protein n=1 Tax=Pelomonas sp. KK5 TaxID=1855730 RepID=UPI00097C263D|nr:hypothetical protein [Pelomonas sp. KK5]